MAARLSNPYAAEHGMLGRVDRFLRSLPPGAWEYAAEATARIEPEPLIYRVAAEHGEQA